MLRTNSLKLFAAVALAALAYTTLPAGEASLKPTATRSTLAPQSPVTIKLQSMTMKGTLVVTVDNVTVLNEPYSKPFFIIRQTTEWEPVKMTTGKHKISAKVVTSKGKTYVSDIYNLEIGKTSGIELLFKTQEGKLTVALTS